MSSQLSRLFGYDWGYVTAAVGTVALALVWLYLRCPPAHRILGKQMLVVARKPG